MTLLGDVVSTRFFLSILTRTSFFTARITVTNIVARGPVIPTSIPTGRKEPRNHPHQAADRVWRRADDGTGHLIECDARGWRPANDGTCRAIECLVELTTVSIQETTTTTVGSNAVAERNEPLTKGQITTTNTATQTWRRSVEYSSTPPEFSVTSIPLNSRQPRISFTAGRFRRWIYHPSEDDVFVLYLKKRGSGEGEGEMECPVR